MQSCRRVGRQRSTVSSGTGAIGLSASQLFSSLVVCSQLCGWTLIGNGQSKIGYVYQLVEHEAVRVADQPIGRARNTVKSLITIHTGTFGVLLMCIEGSLFPHACVTAISNGSAPAAPDPKRTLLLLAHARPRIWYVLTQLRRFEQTPMCGDHACFA